MKRVIYESPTCDPNHVVTQNDLNALERHLDQIWGKLGIDVAFTKHFLDRVNDARNGRQITLCELARIFVETFRQYGKRLATVSAREWEAVLTDKTTNVNVPFVLKHTGKEVEIVAKTVMRKPNFYTPDPKLMVAHFRNGEQSMKEQQATPTRSKTLREWAGFGQPQNAPVGGITAVDDVDVNPSSIEDPEVLTMLNGFLSSLTKRSFINPYYPVQQAFTKLNAVGLSFPLRGLDLGGDSGVVFVPVAHFGGRLGRNLDGSWADNDGISEKIPGGIFLKITYTQMNGEFNVNMQLVPAEDGVQLDPDEDNEVELDMSDIEEDVTTGTSDYTTDDYPLDKTFQPTQDGETIFDSVNEAEERPKVKRGKYGREEWPSPSEWERYYKDKPLSALHKARETAMNGLHNVGPNLDKKNGLMDKIRGLSAAIQNHPKAAAAAAKYDAAKQKARHEDFASFMKKGAALNEADAKVILNIQGVPSNYATLPLGRKMDHHAAIKKFKDEAKHTHFGAKGKPIMRAFGEFKKLHNISQWYFLDRGPQGMKDDSVEIWYK